MLSVSSLSAKVKMSHDSDLLGHVWDKGKTPIKINVLKQLLHSYENKIQIQNLFLFSGFNEGFRLHYTGPRLSSFAHNLASAQTYSSETKLKLLKEVELYRMIGPISQKPISTLTISPISLVPKKIREGVGVAINYRSFVSQKFKYKRFY